jgi:hypothetical protein
MERTVSGKCQPKTVVVGHFSRLQGSVPLLQAVAVLTFITIPYGRSR